MARLTETQMKKILTEGSINDCTDQERKQVFAFAFGEEYMESEDKGEIKSYR